MTSHDTQTGDDVQATATERDDEGGSFLRKHLVSGTASYAVGALSFVRAVASLQRSRRRAALQAAVGAAWVAIGTLQRRMYERRTEAAEAADEPEMNGRDIPFEDQIDEAKETVEEAASETGLMGESEEEGEDEEQEAESEGEDEQETESESEDEQETESEGEDEQETESEGEDEQETESEGEDEQDVESEDSEEESTGTSTEELSSPEPSKDQPDADVPSTHVANEPGEAVGPSSTDAVPEELDADDVDEPGSMNEPDDEDAEEREADEGEETEE